MRDYHNRKSIMLNSPRKVHRFPLVFVLFDKVGKRNMSGNHGYLKFFVPKILTNTQSNGY